MIALVEPPIASRTRSAFSTEAGVMTSRGSGPPERAKAAARNPLASAIRSRSACTAGMVALPGKLMPSVSAMQAMVLAVPISPGACRGRKITLDAIDLVARHAPGAILRPEAPAIGARSELLAVPRHRQHRSRDELHRWPPCRGSAHQ